MDSTTQRDPDNYPEEIRPIIRVLLSYEDSLSDGYGYYCGSDRVKRTLERVAREILTALENNNPTKRRNDV